ncbi:hypothetical protein [Aquimarina algiphila]|uniref:hypothetical protein n=1 Tax=Aquimarina algiphila TaxID=2047982 RepID=UPI002330A209|nr:hypothetical protein [Aquimarina algiphila]
MGYFSDKLESIKNLIKSLFSRNTGGGCDKSYPSNNQKHPPEVPPRVRRNRPLPPIPIQKHPPKVPHRVRRNEPPLPPPREPRPLPEIPTKKTRPLPQITPEMKRKRQQLEEKRDNRWSRTADHGQPETRPISLTEVEDRTSTTKPKHPRDKKPKKRKPRRPSI